MGTQIDYDFALEDQVRECFGRVVYSHKTHERMADQCISRFQTLKNIEIFLLALTSAGATTVLFSDSRLYEIVACVVAVLTLFINTYLKNYDLGSIAQKHRDAASKLWNVRECYFSLLTDLPSMPVQAIIERRDEIQTALAAIYESAPQTNGKAYSEAQDRLKNEEDLTFSDAEIDCFLPLTLKRSGGRPRPIEINRLAV